MSERSTPWIFISHSSRDLELVRRLIALLEAALGISATELRCSSLPGYRLPFGRRTSEIVRAEIKGAKVLVAAITRNSFSSPWVCFEVGARWGFDGLIVPILGPGVESSLLKGPFREYGALSSEIEDDLEQALGEIAEQCGIEKRTREDYEDRLGSLIGLKDEVLGPKNERRVREFFRKNRGRWLQPGAAVGRELGLERKVVRELSERLVNEGYLEYRVDQFGRVYRFRDEA